MPISPPQHPIKPRKPQYIYSNIPTNTTTKNNSRHNTRPTLAASIFAKIIVYRR